MEKMRKERIENAIIELQNDIKSLGFELTELRCLDRNIITELEKNRRVFGFKRKPFYISRKNYPSKILDKSIHGKLFGVKILFDDEKR